MFIKQYIMQLKTNLLFVRSILLGLKINIDELDSKYGALGEVVWSLHMKVSWKLSNKKFKIKTNTNTHLIHLPAAGANPCSLS